MGDYKKILWENVSLLMQQRYGRENLTRCAREAGIGQASMTRIKERETSVGLDVLERLATLFHVEPSALLMPSMTSQEAKIFQSMKHMNADKQDTLVKICDSLAEPEGKSGSAPKCAAK